MENQSYSARGPQEPVFDIVKCAVPSILPVPDGDWLVNPQVPQAPADIADCPVTVIPILEPEPLCPQLTFQGGAQGLAITRIVPPGQEKAVFRITKGECCDFDIDVWVDYPQGP